MCRLVCLCGAGEGGRRNSNKPHLTPSLQFHALPPSAPSISFASRSNFPETPLVPRPPPQAFAPLLSSPLLSSPSPPSQLFCPLCLPPQMLITALLKLRRWLFDVKMHRTKSPRVGLQQKWAKCWTRCIMLQIKSGLWKRRFPHKGLQGKS